MIFSKMTRELDSKHKVFDDYVTEENFGYNFIKIDGKWWMF